MTRRLLAVMVSITVLAIAAFFVPAALAIRSAHERGALLELQREASIVAGRVPPFGPIDETVLQPIVAAEHSMGLYDRDGMLLGGVGPEEGDALVQLGIAGNWVEGSVGDDLVAVVPLRTQDDGTSLAMRIEAPRAARGAADRAIAALGAIAVVIVLGAVAIAVWLARRLNRPLDDLRRWTRAVDGDPGVEPPAAAGIPEIDALRGSLLEGRARIEQLLQRERSFSSHVSHQLRTPVAAMRVAVETELAAPRDDNAAVLTEMLGQLDRLESTISSLLALARNRDRGTEPCRIDEIIATQAEHWRPVARLAERSIDVDLSPVSARVDAAAIRHIVDVLVDNAIRHGSGPIVIRVAQSGDGAAVDVADSGATPSTNDPFADPSNHPHHGIGLRLARSLAASCDGQLTLLDGPTTTFRLALPATVFT